MAAAENKKRCFHEIFPTCLDVKPKHRVGTANFGVVICRSWKSQTNSPPHEYLAVDERKDRGWWVPAGFVDPGESVETGAKRECIEEAGIQPELTGVLRVELGSGRCRFVYAALPIDAAQEPKTQPDKESNGAAWQTMEQMLQMQKAGVKFRGPELYNFGSKLDKGYSHPDMDFLVATYEDENPTWTRYQDSCCPTSRHIKIIVLYNGQVYLQNGISLPEYFVPDTVKNQKTRSWCRNVLPFEIHETLIRVVRVYHAMRNNGASMGFIFAVQAVAKPSEDFQAVSLDKLGCVNEVDREILEYAYNGKKCWNLCLLDPEFKKVKNPGEPDKLLEDWSPAS